ncbi:MAG: hypothetical protein SPI77_00720 [Corynebacterium sp.]|nr:hypothetical protein [Corynebacterium sp.]
MVAFEYGELLGAQLVGGEEGFVLDVGVAPSFDLVAEAEVERSIGDIGGGGGEGVFGRPSAWGGADAVGVGGSWLKVSEGGGDGCGEDASDDERQNLHALM